MARVLILSLVFAPDGVSTAQLLSELALDLQAAGHSVSVVSAKPHYSRDAVAESVQPLTPFCGGLFFRSRLGQIRVIHTAMPRRRRSYLGRLPAWILFHSLAFVACAFLVERPDVILVPSPMLSAGMFGWLLGHVRRAAFVYYALELYPELAVKGGQLRNPVLIFALRLLERFVYRHATAVAVIGEGMGRAVARTGVPAARIHLLPTFVDLTQLRPGLRDNPFAREHGLVGSFVVTYAGNLGFAQGLEVLLDAAAALRDDPDIIFLFVGAGVLRDALIAEARARALGNTRFVEHQPFERVPQIYAASDLCVVSLLGSISREAAPSKLLRIMACGRPTLALVDARSDVADKIFESGAGVVVSPSAPTDVARTVRSLKSRPAELAAMGRAGRAYVSARYSRELVTGKCAALVGQLAADAGSR